MKNGIGLTVGFALIAAMLITPVVMATNFTPIGSQSVEPIEIVQPASGGGRDVYQGSLRIYMSEPESRYSDQNGDNYDFGMLDWGGPTQTLNINDGEVYTYQVQWDASDNGFADVDPDNLVAQTVAFNSTPYTAYSYPPSGNPFFAFWADAAAQAAPGVPGQDFKSVDFTHTVFVEELTKKY